MHLKLSVPSGVLEPDPSGPSCLILREDLGPRGRCVLVAHGVWNIELHDKADNDTVFDNARRLYIQGELRSGMQGGWGEALTKTWGALGRFLRVCYASQWVSEPSLGCSDPSPGCIVIPEHRVSRSSKRKWSRIVLELGIRWQENIFFLGTSIFRA